MVGDIVSIIPELVTSGIMGFLDPTPITWTARHERDLPKIRPVLVRPSSDLPARFKKPVNRNSFLLACLDLTETEQVEHLIVAYGARYGSTTKISSVHHAVGSESRVQLSEAMVRQMSSHISSGHKNEVVVFHNHPGNIINKLFDNRPLASNTDRRTLEGLTLSLSQLCRRCSGGGRVLFYLGENGFVREFNWPRLETILNGARLVSTAMSRTS